MEIYIIVGENYEGGAYARAFRDLSTAKAEMHQMFLEAVEKSTVDEVEESEDGTSYSWFDCCYNEYSTYLYIISQEI